jgi:hypothetical protein
MTLRAFKYENSVSMGCIKTIQQKITYWLKITKPLCNSLCFQHVLMSSDMGGMFPFLRGDYIHWPATTSGHLRARL